MPYSSGGYRVGALQSARGICRAPGWLAGEPLRPPDACAWRGWGRLRRSAGARRRGRRGVRRGRSERRAYTVGRHVVSAEAGGEGEDARQRLVRARRSNGSRSRLAATNSGCRRPSDRPAPGGTLADRGDPAPLLHPPPSTSPASRWSRPPRRQRPPRWRRPSGAPREQQGLADREADAAADAARAAGVRGRARSASRSDPERGARRQGQGAAREARSRASACCRSQAHGHCSSSSRRRSRRARRRSARSRAGRSRRDLAAGEPVEAELRRASGSELAENRRRPRAMRGIFSPAKAEAFGEVYREQLPRLYCMVTSLCRPRSAVPRRQRGRGGRERRSRRRRQARAQAERHQHRPLHHRHGDGPDRQDGRPRRSRPTGARRRATLGFVARSASSAAGLHSEVPGYYFFARRPRHGVPLGGRSASSTWGERPRTLWCDQYGCTEGSPARSTPCPRGGSTTWAAAGGPSPTPTGTRSCGSSCRRPNCPYPPPEAGAP